MGSRLWEGWHGSEGLQAGVDPGGEVGEDLRSEHRTRICAWSLGLGTGTLCSRQQYLQMSDKTQSLIHSLIHSLAHLSTSSFICPGVKTLGNLTGKKPVSRSP